MPTQYLASWASYRSHFVAISDRRRLLSPIGVFLIKKVNLSVLDNASPNPGHGYSLRGSKLPREHRVLRKELMLS